MDIGLRIKERRKEMLMSLEQVGNLVGVERQSVDKWECGQCRPSIDNLIKLEHFLGLGVMNKGFVKKEMGTK